MIQTDTNTGYVYTIATCCCMTKIVTARPLQWVMLNSNNVSYITWTAHLRTHMRELLRLLRVQELSMAGLSVNESLFVIDMDDTSPSILPVGEILPDGIKIGVDRDRGEQFAFYVSEDGRWDILAARPVLAERWVAEGYLAKRALQIHIDETGEIDCYLLISPSSHILLRMTDARVYSSRYYAHLVATTIWSSRNKDHDINLRDGILCELYGVVLPTYTRTPKFADITLLNNALRGQYAEEDLRRPSDFSDGNGGLSRMTFNESLRKVEMEPDTIEPYFHTGELVDDFVQMAPGSFITGPLELRKEYQIFATDSDVVLLAMSAKWAEELIERKLLLNMDLKNVQLGREMIKVMALSRRQALEAFDNRHFGVTQQDVYDIALALYRARRKMPEASFKDALYVHSLGLVLPVRFEGGDRGEDVQLLREVITTGPFAQGPFLTDVLTTAIAIVNSN